MEEIENVWDIPPPPQAKNPEDETEEEEKARLNSPEQKKHEYAMEVFVWWLDCFLPFAVGLEFWGPDIRCFHYMTDKKQLPGSNTGEKKVYVTVTSEAFAHVLYANCRDKWQASHEYIVEARKKGVKKAKIPAYNKKDESTWKFQNKWSSSRTGQVQGGGWKMEAIEYLTEMQNKVQEFRDDQKKKGYSAYKTAQRLIREANDVKLDATGEPENPKKRKGAPNAEKPETKKPEIIYLDE